ncbi:MAG: polysaccharide deacetylase family protein [Clostridia bacterium]|nr:polysaccharide deacetylase family protein [Clostridia bacterium]
MKGIIMLLIAAMLLCSCSRGGETTQGLATTENEKVSDVGTMSESVNDYYSIDNKGSGWGFKKIVGQKPDIPADITEMLTKYDAYYMDLSEEKVLYLTFDEGYENGYTAQILDTLKKCEVPAAFFVTGSYFDREQELIKRMVNEGHIVGNHTENHPNMHQLQSAEKMQEELKILDDKYFAVFGEHMKYMRPPEGEYSERVLAAAKDAGYKTMFWSFAYKDWQRDVNMGADHAFNAVTPYLHSGAIILLHAVSQDNAAALESIINYAREKGYEFKSLDDIK